MQPWQPCRAGFEMLAWAGLGCEVQTLHCSALQTVCRGPSSPSGVSPSGCFVPCLGWVSRIPCEPNTVTHVRSDAWQLAAALVVQYAQTHL